MDLHWGSRTARGRASASNEDACKGWLDQPAVRRVGRGALFAVADGEGPLGRRVAWATVGALDLFFEQPAAEFSVGTTLRTALGNAHDAARRIAFEDHSGDSGCTLSLIYVTPSIDKGLLVAVGDTAVWMVRRGRVVNLVRPLPDVRDGAPSRIGLGQPTACNRALKFAPGDVLLLATRGITDVVDDDAIADIADFPTHPQDLAGDVLRAAGSPRLDATVLALRFGPCPPKRDADEAP